MNNNLDRTNDAGFYHDGSRRLQDQFDTRRVADRLNEVQVHSVFSPEDRAPIESARMFFLATADALGKPDCSYKGSLPGFVRIVDERTLAFPDYNGNGMYRSLGNVLLNWSVALLFVDFERPQPCDARSDYEQAIYLEALSQRIDRLLVRYKRAARKPLASAREQEHACGRK